MSKNKKNKKHQQTSTSQSDLRARKKEAVMGSDKKKGA